MGSQGHFHDFMAAGGLQNIPPAIKANNKGRARVCKSWELGNPCKNKFFSGALHSSLQEEKVFVISHLDFSTREGKEN